VCTHSSTSLLKSNPRAFGIVGIRNLAIVQEF
jgi:hypothetical protein